MNTPLTPYAYFVSFYWNSTMAIPGLTGGYGNREIGVDSPIDEYGKVHAIEASIRNAVLEDLRKDGKIHLPNGAGIRITVLNFILLRSSVQ